MASYKHIEVTPVAGAMGADIGGVDVADLDDETFGEIHDAFLTHQALFFRDQEMTPEQQIALARRFGEIHYHPYMKGLDDHPEILALVKDADDTYTFGATWHTDQMFNPQPAKATMLYAKETPSAGGDTMYANMYLAYDALSEGMQEMLKDIKTWNVGDRFKQASGVGRKERYQGNTTMTSRVRDPGNLQTETAHPLIRTHPETKRNALFIGNHTQSLDGFDEAEAEPLLTFLRKHSVRPEFTCRFQWQPGSLAIWDNRCVQHHAVADYNERRCMHRITIAGDTPY